MDLPETARWKKVEAAMDASVADPSIPVGTLLLVQILFVLLINVLQNGIPAGQISSH